jgi:ankyrin repeat protein
MKKALGIMLMSSLLLSFIGCATTPPPKRPHTPLGEAAHEGQIDRVNTLLAKGVDITEKEEALLFSSRNGHTEIVKILLANGANANAKDSDGFTPLMLAALKGYTDLARTLLGNGADVNAKDKDGGTALLRAAASGHTEIVKILLANGADVNAKYYNKTTPLWLASIQGHTEIVKILLANGANVNAKGANSKGICTTILSETAEDAHVDVARVLINSGADVDQAIACLNLEETRLSAFNDNEYIAAYVARYKQAADLLERLQEKQRRVGEPAVSQGLTKEEVKGTAQNTIEIATNAQKGEDKAHKITNHHSSVAGSIDKKWAVIIGISKYQYTGQDGLRNLIFADDDARAFANVLMSLDWNASHIKLLINKEATQRNIMIALESWLTKAGPNDLIVLYWAGHGFPDPEDPEKVYFACYDTDISIPVTGYRMDRVRTALHERKARNVILLADTCHAGKLITRGDRGISIIPHIDRMNRQQEVPKGWIFMVGADTDRQAIEHTSWTNGAFTHGLIKGLSGEADGYQSVGPKDKIVTMGELRAYLNSAMPDETQRVLGVAKRPLITTSSGDPDIWNLNLRAW